MKDRGVRLPAAGGAAEVPRQHGAAVEELTGPAVATDRKGMSVRRARPAVARLDPRCSVLRPSDPSLLPRRSEAG